MSNLDKKKLISVFDFYRTTLVIGNIRKRLGISIYLYSFVERVFFLKKKLLFIYFYFKLIFLYCFNIFIYK